MSLPTNHPLPTALSAAVPLRIMELLEISDKAELLQTVKRWASEAQDVLDKTGEAILFRTKPGETAKAFNATAKAIAALSFCPGGVTIFGQHYETKLSERRYPQ